MTTITGFYNKGGYGLNPKPNNIPNIGDILEGKEVVSVSVINKQIGGDPNRICFNWTATVKEL